MSAQQISRTLGAAILRAARDPKMPAADLLILAGMAEREGAVATARALRARAGGKASTSGLVETSPAKSSPLPGATSESWDRFASALRENRSPDAEERGRVGDYSISVRRLADLGIVKNPKKTGDTWNAEWSGVSKEKFSGDRKLQEEVLARSLRGYADQVREKYGKALGKDLNGRAVTLSGLLGVAHVAGIRGLETWLRDGKVREKFPGTTKLFEATNGIF